MKTKRCLVLALLAGFCISDAAQAQFFPFQAKTTYSMSQYKGDYEIQLARLPKDKGFELRFVRDNKTALAFPVHLLTVFKEVKGVVYYTVFSPWTSGCKVVAYNLKDQKELWRTELRALGPVSHSAYSNAVNIDADEKTVRINAEESYGRYYEQLDAKTGEFMVAQVTRVVGG